MFEVPATARSSADTPCCWAVVGVFWCKGQSDFIVRSLWFFYLDCQCRKLAGALKKIKQACPLRGGSVPCGDKSLCFYVVWAVYAER